MQTRRLFNSSYTHTYAAYMVNLLATLACQLLCNGWTRLIRFRGPVAIRSLNCSYRTAKQQLADLSKRSDYRSS